MRPATRIEKTIMSVPTIILIVGIVLYISSINKVNTVQQRLDMYELIKDSMKTYRKKDSSQVATIQNYESSNTKLFTNLMTKDLEILKLQKLVKDNEDKLKHGGSVTTFTDNTKIITKEVTVVKRDTILLEDCQDVVYSSNFNRNNWVKGNITASYDSTEIDFEINNQYDVVIGEDGKWYTWNRKTYAEVTNHNPYTTITTMKSYSVKAPKKKRLGIGFHVGYGIPLNLPLRTSFLIGIGLQYNIIELK